MSLPEGVCMQPPPPSLKMRMLLHNGIQTPQRPCNSLRDFSLMIPLPSSGATGLRSGATRPDLSTGAGFGTLKISSRMLNDRHYISGYLSVPLHIKINLRKLLTAGLSG